jgi:hypothetical protein
MDIFPAVSPVLTWLVFDLKVSITWKLSSAMVLSGNYQGFIITRNASLDRIRN